MIINDPIPLSEDRLKARLWVQATIRACHAQGFFATVVRTGDDDAGMVLIKQNLMGAGFRVLTPSRTVDGAPAWLRGTGVDPVPEPVADAYIQRQVDRDYDIWVIEIEHAGGRLPFEALVV
jgi:GMP synthase (glutamine-hydrolysing)